MAKNLGALFKGDPVIWVIYFFLCIISLIEVYSAASTLAYASGSFWWPLLKQAAFLAGGTIVVLVVHKVHYRFFKTIPATFLAASFLMLIFTMAFGPKVNGASRWIDIAGIQFQPSEIAKVGVVGATALILAARQRENGATVQAFKNIMLILCIWGGLIVTENLSTAALLFVTVFIMMFIGRVPMKLLGGLLGIGMIVVGLAAALVIIPDDNSKLYEMPGMHRLGTWHNRIAKYADDTEITPEMYDIDKDAQVAHANIAIASCNVVGKIPGNSVERDFLSQAYSDFIYAIIIEEMGIEGGIIVVVLYVTLLFRAGRIASRCERSFPAFLAMGLALLLVLQAMVNMEVAVGNMPVTGQPLPMISRGGTSTFITALYFGIILSISRYARKTEKPQNTSFDAPEEVEEAEDMEE